MINEELMLVALHPNKWWNFCMPQDGKKEMDPIFIEKFF